ncbi:MAG: hypothetical protein IIX48_09075 [Lachnospiraceae bacterium]|nr:hypothetical protein [Lachnospiraceae bacterium]
MKKSKKVVVSLIMVFLVMILQGCSPSDFSFSKLTTPTTTHEVTMDKYSSYKFEVALTADMTQKYEWYIYTNGDIDETGVKLRKGLFNKTYYWNYGYNVSGENDFYVYLLLVKDGDLENCRAFPYLVRFTDPGISLNEEDAFTLSGNPDLYKEVTENISLTTSY